MNESKKSIIIVIIAILALAGLVYFVKERAVEKIMPEEEAKTGEAQPPKIITPEEVGAGKTGETEETFKGEETVVLPAEPGGSVMELSAIINNDSGTVKEIKKDSLIVLGSGYSFADQRPRDLTLKFTAKTITISADYNQRQVGLQGLKNLVVGERVLFESPENIRGKTEFEVSYVNKL